MKFDLVGDIGSGKGNFSKRIEQFRKKGVTLPRVLNVDYVSSNPGDVKVDEDGRMNLEDNSLDAACAVYSVGCYADASNPFVSIQTQFSEIARVIKPGGEFILNLLPITNPEDMPDRPEWRRTPETEEDALNARLFTAMRPNLVGSVDL